MSTFNDVPSLQAFLLWCRDQRICVVDVGEIRVTFHDSAFHRVAAPAPAAPENKRTETDYEDVSEEEILWSAK